MKNIVKIFVTVCILTWVGVNLWFICSETFMLEFIGFSALAIPLVLALDSPLDIEKANRLIIKLFS